MNSIQDERPKQHNGSLLKPILISSAIITSLLSISAYTQSPVLVDKTPNSKIKAEHTGKNITRERVEYSAIQEAPSTTPVTPKLTKIQPNRSLTKVYSWVDETGQKHYSDAKHPGATVSTLRPNVVTFTPSAVQTRSKVSQTRVHRTSAFQTQKQSNGKFNAKSCLRLRSELEKVHAQMRAGYKASQYNQLASKERRISNSIFKHCD